MAGKEDPGQRLHRLVTLPAVEDGGLSVSATWESADERERAMWGSMARAFLAGYVERLDGLRESNYAEALASVGEDRAYLKGKANGLRQAIHLLLREEGE